MNCKSQIRTSETLESQPNMCSALFLMPCRFRNRVLQCDWSNDEWCESCINMCSTLFPNTPVPLATSGVQCKFWGRAAGVDCGSFGFWGFTAEALEPLGVDSGCSVLCFEASMDCPSEFAALALEMTRIWSIAEGFHQCFLGGLQPSFAISHIHADYLGRLYKSSSPLVFHTGG